jgi:hypothetical protein
MWRDNFLDPLIARMRRRWVTEPHYRALMSGVIALTTLLLMCGCMGVVSAFANGVLNGSGLGAVVGPPGSQSGSPGVIAGAPSFPTATVPGWAVPPTPISSPVPTSQTPQPSPTRAPAPTPDATGTPCAGCATITDHAESPNPWKHCITACDTITLTTSLPNTTVNVSITFSGGGIVAVAGQTTTDDQGNGTFTFALAGLPGTGKAHVILTAPGGNVPYRYPYQ